MAFKRAPRGGRGEDLFGSYSLRAIVKCPDGLVDVDDVSEGIRKGGPFGDRGRHCRFKEIHGRQTPYLHKCTAGVLSIEKERKEEGGGRLKRKG